MMKVNKYCFEGKKHNLVEVTRGPPVILKCSGCKVLFMVTKDFKIVPIESLYET